MTTCSGHENHSEESMTERNQAKAAREESRQERLEQLKMARKEGREEVLEMAEHFIGAMIGPNAWKQFGDIYRERFGEG